MGKMCTVSRLERQFATLYLPALYTRESEPFILLVFFPLFYCIFLVRFLAFLSISLIFQKFGVQLGRKILFVVFLAFFRKYGAKSYTPPCRLNAHS